MAQSDQNLTALIPAWVDGQLCPIGKLETHQRGLKHQAVSVFILNQAHEILLQQRAAGKYHTPGLWANTCCTHPHWGENPLATADRRLSEELGIFGIDLIHKGQIEYRADVGDGLIEHEVVEVYLGFADDHITITPNPAEVGDYKWVSKDQLQQDLISTPTNFTPWLKIYMQNHSEMIFSADTAEKIQNQQD